MRKRYPTDLSDAEWNYIEPHVPPPQGHGRPRIHSPREILNAIFYVLKSGCQWRLLPHDFPRWPTLFTHRRHLGADQPGYLGAPASSLEKKSSTQCRHIVDSQSVKTLQEEWVAKSAATTVERRLRAVSATCSGGHRGFRPLKAKLHSAKVMDWDGIKTLLQRADEQFPRLKHLWVDAGYRREEKGKEWVEKTFGWSVDLVERPKKPAPKEVLMAWAEQWLHEGVKVDWEKLMPPKGFVVLPRRWVVERSFAWICHNRRMSKDYERLCASGEAFSYMLR